MLAGKVEETPKKVRDIVKTARSLLSDADFEQFGNDPRVCSIFISLNFFKNSSALTYPIIFRKK